MRETITLSSSRACVLENPILPLLHHYHVLSFPPEQGTPSLSDADEMMMIAARKGRDLSTSTFFRWRTRPPRDSRSWPSS